MRHHSIVLLLTLLVVSTPIAVGCSPQHADAPALSPEEQGRAILQALKDEDLAALAEMVHPEKGLRFSPYAYVQMDKDLFFGREALRTSLDSQEVHIWGAWDGSGKPITMTFREYYQRFIYDHDYLQARQVGVNEFIGRGNTINNALEAYPGATIIEYHFPGFDPKYDGMDWCSLRLVMEEYEGRWCLVGIIHAEWTI